VSGAVRPPPWREADAEALRDAIARTGEPGALPHPGFADYVRDLARAVQEWFYDLLGRAVPVMDLPLLEVMVWVVTLGAAAAVAGLLVLALRRRRRRMTLAGAAVPLAGEGEPAAPGDAGWWWNEAARRLEAGEVRPALAALWWWVARRLDPPGLDRSWTTSDLLRGGGITARRLPLRRLDRLLWGPGAPARVEAEALRDELAERLA
jgi:hypothetical protein